MMALRSKPNRNGLRRVRLAAAALAVAAVSLLTAGNVQAVVYIYNNTTTGTTQWSAGTNWSAVPVSATDTTLTFGNGASLVASAAITANDDIAGNFLLNVLNFTYAGPASGTAPTVTLTGNPLEFVSNGATTPTMVINSTSAVKPTLTISNSIVLTNNLEVNATTAGTLGGLISGGGSLTKTGAGTLNLGAVANTSFTGGLVIKQGLVIGGNNANTFGADSNAITLGDSTLGANAVLALANNAVNAKQAITVASGAGTRTIQNQSTSGTATFSGAITLSHEVIFGATGVGTLAVSGGVTGTGNITVNAGGAGGVTLQTGAVDPVGTITNSGAGAGAATISADIGSNVTTVTQNSATSSLTLSGTNSYTGTTTVSAGTLLVKKAASLPNYTTQAVSVNGTSTLVVNAGAGSPTEWSDTEIANFLGAANATFASGTTFGIDTSGGNFTYGNGLTKTGVGLVKSGANTLTLSAANTYTGNTTISGGTLQLSGSGTLGGTGGVTTAALTMTGGTLDLNNVSTDIQVGGLATGTSASAITNIANAQKLIVSGTTATGILANTTVTGAGTLQNNTSTVAFNVGTTAAATLDMSGLGTFTANVSGFNVGGTGTTGIVGTVKLAPTSTITSSGLLSIGPNGTTATGQGNLRLGTGLTTLYVGDGTLSKSILVERGRGNTSTMSYLTQNVGSSVTIRGSTGGASKASMLVGNYASNSTSNGVTGTVDFTGGTVDAKFSTVYLGYRATGDTSGNATGNVTGNLTIDGAASVVTADLIALGRYDRNDSPTADLNLTGNLYIKEGNVTAGTLRIADKGTFGQTGNAYNKAIGLVSISGGSTTVNTAFVLGDHTIYGTSASQVSGTLNITGGLVTSNVAITTGSPTATKPAKTTLTLNGGTLDMKGFAIGTATNIVGDVASGGALNWQSGTLKNVGSINGTAGLTKTTTGTLVLAGTNNYTGNTTVSGGTLNLDFSASDSPAANIANNAANSSALVLGGTTLRLTGKASTANTQRFNGTTINLGLGASAIVLNANPTANPLFLNLGGITRNAGGTVDFTLPTGAQSGTNGIATLTPDSSGILGGWATVNAADWAHNDGTNIVACANYTDDTWAAGNNTNVTGSSAPTSGSTTNTLRFNHAGADTVTLDGVNTIAAGGILVTGNVGNNLSTITGGTVKGAASDYLMVFQNNTSNGLRIESVIDDNTAATGLIKNGAGVLTLAAANLYTGGTLINAGTLEADNAAALNATTGNITFGGGTLRYTANSSGTDWAARFKSTASGGIRLDTNGQNVTLSGNIDSTNTMGLAKSGAGKLTLAGTNAYTGGSSVSAGTLQFALPAALPAGAVSATGTGTLALNVGGSSDFSLAQMTTFLSTASFASGTSFLIDMSNNVTTPQTYAGVISGPQGVVVANLGANVLALNAANTFTGGFTLVAGTVQGNDANSFGANSGTIYLGDTAASSAGVTLQTSRSVTVSNNITLNPGTTGTIEIGGSDANYTCIYSGNIAMNNNLYFNGRKAGSKLSGGTITVGGVGSTPLTLTCSKYGVLDDPIVLANRDLIFNAPDGITSATSGTVTGTGNFTVNYIGNSGSSFTFNAIVNNVGTISNTSPTSVSGNQPITFSGGIGSNVTGIIQNSIKSPTIVSGLLNVASGGTTLTNTSGTKALTISGGVAGTGNLILNNNSATDGGITLTTANVTNAGTITNSGTGTGAVSIDAVIGSSVTGVVQNSGTSQLTLNAANTYAGPTTISAGTLKLGAAGSIAASPTISVAAGGVFDVSSVTGGFQLASGQTLKGGGAVNGAVTVASGSTLQPGSSPGTLSTAGEAWSNGGNYNWMIYNATGTAGAGYSQLAITGTLNLASLTANGFNLNLWSLSGIGPDVNGNALNFNNASPAAWTIATTTAGITGFNADNFSIHTTANNGTGGFSNALAGGSFGLSVTGNNLLLNFTPGSSAHLSTWTGSAGGSWGDSLKWDNDVPNAVGDTATFYNSIAESVDPAVVLLKANRTVSELSFTSTGNRKYQIANDTAEIFSLTLAKTSGAASIAASGTNAHVIDVPVVASSDLTVTQSDTASLTLGDVTTAAGTTMTVTTQSTGTLTVGAISGSGSTSVAGNSHLSASSIVQNTLTIGAGGSVTIRETTAGGAGASPVPEPGTWALLCAGAACLLAFARRRRTAG